MMLSILIPTYNYDCSHLVGSLHSQCQQIADTEGLDYEIIVADDGSTDHDCIGKNEAIGQLPHCTFMRRDKNVGRSRIRNLLADMAHGDMLLFLDQDGRVTTNDFVARFITMGMNHKVVCGRMVQPPQPPEARFHLRYFYELRYQRQMTAERLNSDSQSPFRSFCFLIHREVALRVRMDEEFRGYGYEDVRYGLDLQAAGYTIVHADIPLMNDDIEDNPTYVAKTEEALRTLYAHRHSLGHSTRLLCIANRLQKYGIMPLLRTAGRPLLPLLRRNLCSLHPGINLFNTYKILYYASL